MYVYITMFILFIYKLRCRREEGGVVVNILGASRLRVLISFLWWTWSPHLSWLPWSCSHSILGDVLTAEMKRYSDMALNVSACEVWVERFVGMEFFLSSVLRLYSTWV
jgi:hypothetical protein